MTCETCGQALQIGEWPFCPHGFPLHGGVSVIDDQLEGGARWCETMGHDPVWLDGTKSQRKKLMELHGVQDVNGREQSVIRKRMRMHDEQLRDERRRY